MNLKFISKIFILPFTIPLTCAFSSCSKEQVDTTVKDIDGYDWKGREYGLFGEKDYVINNDEKSVTYINGLKYYGTNVVIPDYVWVKKEKYKVLLGKGCFKNNHFLMGRLDFNIHTTFIPEECFSNCDGLETIVFKNYITSFEKKCFYSCKILTFIASDPIFLSRVNYFKDHCFFETCLTKDFVFGNELKEIGPHAFSGAVGLNVLDLSHNTNFVKISDYAFCNCKGLYKVILPPNFKEFGDHAFLGCSSLISIVLPRADMELSIGDYAFFGCKTFKGFSRKCTFTRVGHYCFSDCTDYVLDNDCLKNPKLTEIGNQSFAYCHNSSLAIPKNIKYIDRFAFWQNVGEFGQLQVLDFSNFKSDDVIPKICGVNVFFGAAPTGVIYISDSANIYDWTDALTNKGIVIGSTGWTINVKNNF